jgi:hypothetical protein
MLASRILPYAGRLDDAVKHVVAPSSGVGPSAAGDTFEADIDGMGSCPIPSWRKTRC